MGTADESGAVRPFCERSDYSGIVRKIIRRVNEVKGYFSACTWAEAFCLACRYVLSACETGLGRVTNGEGVFGLQRALQEAGAEAVLMSMWPVPDPETQTLMTLFYEKWQSGMEKHQALHEAQMELRRELQLRWQVDQPPPHFWAAFVLVGR